MFTDRDHIHTLMYELVDERTAVRDAARVAMRRPSATRFEPLVCVDEFGACAGVLRIDRLIDVLARESGDSRSAHHALEISRRAGRHRRKY